MATLQLQNAVIREKLKQTTWGEGGKLCLEKTERSNSSKDPEEMQISKSGQRITMARCIGKEEDHRVLLKANKISENLHLQL